ncbi:MAG: hypothetical protein J0H01_35240 [Rhizobiales bacterium]|nr:hypothetical protein [Hyphomicrobiales bacterium]
MELPSESANPEVIGLYLTAMANGSIGGVALAVSTIDRRLSALTWTFRQLKQVVDRKDPQIATVLCGIKRVHGKRPAAKEAALTEDLLAMLDTLDLRKLGHIRDKAILLVGFAGGLRRSEIVGLDVGPGQSVDTDEACMDSSVAGTTSNSGGDGAAPSCSWTT